MNNELKNCPFCNGKAHLSVNTDNYNYPYNKVLTASITCGRKGCEAMIVQKTKRKVINAWNRRK